jgi:hypothetical protein
MIPGIRRRLFVVPLAENDHGKTTLVRSLVSQGTRNSYMKLPKGERTLYTPWAQAVDAYVFPRSFQEAEKKDHPKVKDALDANDRRWRQRDLIIMPSHLFPNDCAGMIAEAHAAGFDALAVSIFLDRKEIEKERYVKCMSLSWDARWCVDNKKNSNSNDQVEALGRDLWVAISATVFLRS